jgi:hypothetical protein
MLSDHVTRRLNALSATWGGQKPLRLFEIALVLVRLDHVARFIVNPNHSTV